MKFDIVLKAKLEFTMEADSREEAVEKMKKLLNFKPLNVADGLLENVKIEVV